MTTIADQLKVMHQLASVVEDGYITANACAALRAYESVRYAEPIGMVDGEAVAEAWAAFNECTDEMPMLAALNSFRDRLNGEAG